MKAPDHLQHHFAEIYTDRGPNVEEAFLRDLCNVQDIIARLWHHHSQTPMEPLTPTENTYFNTATECYICKKAFQYEGTLDQWIKQRQEMKEMKKKKTSRKRKINSEEEEEEEEDKPKFINHFKSEIDSLGPAVRDHDHWTGKFR